MNSFKQLQCSGDNSLRNAKIISITPLFIPGKSLSSIETPEINKRVEKRKFHYDNDSNGINDDVTDDNSLDSNESLNILKECNSWRNGPAKLWYDMINAPNNFEEFDYGFKLKNVNDDDDDETRDLCDHNTDPDDAFMMVTQMEWEKDVIWNGDDVKTMVLSKREAKTRITGWIPDEAIRVAPEFVSVIKKNNKLKIKNNKNESQPKKRLKTVNGKKCIVNDTIRKETIPKDAIPKDAIPKDAIPKDAIPKDAIPKDAIPQETDDYIHDIEYTSIFSIENEQLKTVLWEENVIWDPNSMDIIPVPYIVPLDPNDEIKLPDNDDDSNDEIHDKCKNNHHKQSQIQSVVSLLNPFNISDDEFYAPINKKDDDLIQKIRIIHSIPALELRLPYFPTSLKDLHKYHRRKLKRYSYGVNSKNGPHYVLPITNCCNAKDKSRDEEKRLYGDCNIFFMRNSDDLSACDGELILMEYAEEFPPLLMQIGMGSKIINYYKKKNFDDTTPKSMYKYGEDKLMPHKSPFIGNLNSGQSLQSIETNLFRAPIYEHTMTDNEEFIDFLIIRTRNNYYVRRVETVYTIGQELPLIEVPAPRSVKYFQFIRKFIRLFLYRNFQKYDGIKFDIICNAFPNCSADTIRKNISNFVDFDRQIINDKSTLLCFLKDGHRIPDEEELRNLVTAEECCAYYSVLEAENRLNAAGYGGKLLLSLEETENEELPIDQEMKCAPWLTTQAYVSALNGKALLNLDESSICISGGVFPFTSISAKLLKVDGPLPKKSLSLTKANLRKLSLKSAQQWLISFGFPKENAKKVVNRVEAIDLITKLSAVKGKGLRAPNKRETLENQYKEKCQKIFELQNNLFSSTEVWSSDDDESETEEIEEYAWNLEKIICENKTIEELDLENEESERRDLLNMFMSEPKKNNDDDKSVSDYDYSEKVLRIIRTFVNQNGEEFQRIEIVRRREFIDAYLKIRNTKDDEFIKKFCDSRVKPNVLKVNHNKSQTKNNVKSHVKNNVKSQINNNLKSQINNNIKSQFKDNVKSPNNGIKKFNNVKSAKKSHTKIIKVMNNTVETNNYVEAKLVNNDHILENHESLSDVISEISDVPKSQDVTVEDTKVKFSKRVVEEAFQITKQELELQKKQREWIIEYFPKTQTKRCRIDPLTKMKDIFDNIILRARKLPNIDADPFMDPVSPEEAPDYYDIVKEPMCLKWLRTKVQDKEYKCRKEFLYDLQLIAKNSAEYNGPDHEMTHDAQEMVKYCIEEFAKNEELLTDLEIKFNPFIAIDSKNRASYLIKAIIDSTINEVRYESFCKTVMKLPKNSLCDFGSLFTKIQNGKYDTVDDVITDIEMLHTNISKFYGNSSIFSHNSEEIASKIKSALLYEYSEQLKELSDVSNQ